MKKWYEYQMQHIVEADSLVSEFLPVTNILDQSKDIFNFLKTEYLECKNTNNEKLMQGCSLVGHPQYAQYLKNYYIDPIIKKNIEDWCNDPNFQQLMTLPSIDIIDIKQHYCDIGKHLCQILNRDYSNSRINLQVQPPGYVSPLHIDTQKSLDRTKNKKFNINDQMDYDRFLIFFDDWQTGQVVQMNEQFIKWKAGDVYSWTLRDVPHALANIGYYTRYSILLFAEEKKQP
jgi:hypothetical protein